MYRLGDGVPKDIVSAHMWYNVAGANRNEAAGVSRDEIEDEMSGAQIEHATELARMCVASDYNDCER